MALSSNIFKMCLCNSTKAMALVDNPVISRLHATLKDNYSTLRTQTLSGSKPEINTRTGKRKTYLKEKSKVLKEARSNPEREVESRKKKLLIPLDEVQREWTQSQGVSESIRLAKYYGITKDLFDGKDVHVSQWMNIVYSSNQSVFKGNKLLTSMCTSPPDVSYEHSKDAKYLLLLTNPDGNIENSKMEILHWMVCNIPGDEIKQGITTMPYTQPLPWYGSEFHRLVFVLFKQNEDIDLASYSENKLSELSTRSFSTQSFMKKYDGVIQPTAISWFQCKYDGSVSSHWQMFSDVHEEPRFCWEEFITSEQITKEERLRLKNNRYRLK